MSEIYTVIVGILGILAISGLFVGVTNDAVNFLNSAIGSKAAPMRTILLVASIGIIIGVVTSSGMMEVAAGGSSPMQNGHRRFCSIVFSPLPNFYTFYCIIVFPAVQAVRILVHTQKRPGPAAQRADRLRS